MLRHIVGVNEDIIEVNDNTDIEHVWEDFVHIMLESSRRVGKSKGHHKPFKRAIASAECSFPFVTIRNADKVVGMLKIDLCIKSGFPWCIQEVRDQGKWVTILLGNLVETTVVDAKM